MTRISVLIKVETYSRLGNHFLPRGPVVGVNEWLLLNELKKEAAREEIVMFVIWEAIGQSKMRSKSTQRLSVGRWEFNGMLQRVSV